MAKSSARPAPFGRAAAALKAHGAGGVLRHTALELQVADLAAQIAHLALVRAVPLGVRSRPTSVAGWFHRTARGQVTCERRRSERCAPNTILLALERAARRGGLELLSHLFHAGPFRGRSGFGRPVGKTATEAGRNFTDPPAERDHLAESSCRTPAHIARWGKTGAGGAGGAGGMRVSCVAAVSSFAGRGRFPPAERARCAGAHRGGEAIRRCATRAPHAPRPCRRRRRRRA